MILDAKGQPVEVEPIRAQEQDAFERRMLAFVDLPPKPPESWRDYYPPKQSSLDRVRLWIVRRMIWWLRIDPGDT